MRPLARLADRWPNVPIAGAAAALLLLLAGLAVIALSARNNYALKQQETAVQAQILAATVTAPLDFGDPATAQEAVAAFGVNRQVAAAGVYARDGSLFAGYTRSPGLLPPRAGAPARESSRMLEAIAPVARGGTRIGSVYLKVEREPLSRRFARFSLIGLLTVMAALVVLILGIAHTAMGRANRELETRAGALADALGRLQVEVDERARAEEELRQAQKMQALGQLTGGIAHDFNNLLTVIQGSADILRRPNVDEPRRIRFAEAIVQTAGRAAALTSQLLTFARRQPLKPQILDLNEKIAGMADLLDRTIGERVAVRTDLGEGLCPIEADPAQLEAAILNVCVNARDAMPEGGSLTLATRDGGLPDGRRAVVLSVSDTGTGIEPDMLARVFEPFFTTKSVGKGTGLGLSQVYGFAAQSGGEAGVVSEVGVGTTVTMTLPCSETAVAQEETKEEAGLPSARRGHVLIVDDNEEVGALAEALCSELGHRVSRARSGAEALILCGGGAFDAVFTDVVMPGMSGIELAEALANAHPGLPVVLTTGFSDEIARAGAGDRPVVFKPYKLEALAAALDAALGPAAGPLNRPEPPERAVP
jgi:signal transduction histidine kinase/ActR/RegA family two-component response regulator